jgi:hypothetical protein
MIEILPITDNKTVIVTLVVGKSYEDLWTRFAAENWKSYCIKHGIGLYIENKDLDCEPQPKKKQWQKLLLGDSILKINPSIQLICYLDSDILINPHSPNIFDFHISNTIGLVSSINNLPFKREIVLRRIAFFRKNFVSSNYPLDSALFISNKDMYAYHNFVEQPDYACTGVIMFESKNSNFLKSIFEKYKLPLTSITDGGEEPFVNYELQKNFSINWLDYKFQAQWLYEMALNYPFLYLELYNSKLFAKCIQATLLNNYFLHFSGSWSEGSDWQNRKIFKLKKWNRILSSYYEYLKQPVFGKPVGKITPKLKRLYRVNFLIKNLK